MNKKIMNFELDKKSLKMKDILDKEFVEIEVYAISDAYPNRNLSVFPLESMKAALGSFANRPILGAWDTQQEDFKSHNGNLEYDASLDTLYYDYTSPGCETPLGMIRESDKVEIVYDEERKENWIVVHAVLWGRYAYNQIKKLLRKNGRSRISVEIEVDESHIDENNYEILDRWRFTGLTILGTENGEEVQEGIENAHLSILDLMNNELFQKKQKALAFAYSALDDYNNKQHVETPDKVMSLDKDSNNKNFDTKESDVVNEEVPQITMEDENKKKEEISEMPEDKKDTEALEQMEQKAEPTENKEEESVCEDEPKTEEACDCEKVEEAVCDESTKEESCPACDDETEPEKAEESCGTCAAEEETCGEKFEDKEDSEDDKDEKSDDSDDSDSDDSDDSKDSKDDDDKEDFAENDNEGPKNADGSIDINQEPERVDVAEKSMKEIVEETTASIVAPEVQTSAENLGDANAEAMKVLENAEAAIVGEPEKVPEAAKPEEQPEDQVKEPEDKDKELDFEGTEGAETKVEEKEFVSEAENAKEVAEEKQEEFAEKQEEFAQTEEFAEEVKEPAEKQQTEFAEAKQTEFAEQQQTEFAELLKKYNELEEKFNKLNEANKLAEAEKLAQFGADFINADTVVNEEAKKDFVSQVEEKCKAFELNAEEEVTKFAKGLMAMYYYEHFNELKEEKHEEKNAADFAIGINRTHNENNNASRNNKLKDAINKLNYLNKEE